MYVQTIPDYHKNKWVLKNTPAISKILSREKTSLKTLKERHTSKGNEKVSFFVDAKKTPQKNLQLCTAFS